MSSATRTDEPKKGRVPLAPGLKSDPIPVIENLIVWMAAAFGIVSALATLAIVFAFVIEVIARWVGQPIDPTNIVSGLLVTAIFTGLAWTTIRGEQISVQFISDRFGAKVGRILDIAIWAIGSAYLLWFVYAAFETAAMNTWPIPEMVPDGVGLAPRWPWRWVLAIGSVPFVLVALLNLVRALIGRTPYDDVERPEEGPKGEMADALEAVDEEVADAQADAAATRDAGDTDATATGDKK